MITLIILAVIAIFFFYGISIYNRLVKLKTMVEEAWSSIDVMLKKRHDLIPNLVETVKGYATHERATLDSVTRARAAAMGANTIQEKEVAEKNLNQAMMNLNAVAEQYPDLKANQNFLKLQDELASTENQILTARTRFNESVQKYNNYILVFPNSIFLGNYKEKPYFDAVAGAEKPVDVEFDFNKEKK